MKSLLLLFYCCIPLLICAQHYERYYDFRWNPCSSAEARFYSELNKKDDVWERKDYFIHERSLQMIGSYTDTSCKIPVGHFEYYYPNKNLESIGVYKNGKKNDVWLTYYPNQIMKDSNTYLDGNAIGINMSWHSNGYLMDSSVFNVDGSGIEISWFDNGNPSAAGRYSPGYKQNGKWQYFHKNGKLSAIELYDKGTLIDKQYFDEDGNPVLDTTNMDKPAEFPGGKKAWQKFLLKNVYFPSQYKFENADKAVVVIEGTIDEEGNMTAVEVNTPLYPPFDKIAVDAVKKSPKWIPAIQHNRHVKYLFQQAVYFSQQ